MNTKTMRLPPRRVLTPSSTINKRKEREEPFDRPKPITPTPTPTTTTTTTTASKLLKLDRPTPRPSPEPIITTPTSSKSGSIKGLELTPSNQLLAGCLAHEYLTKGTLLGQPWAPSRAEGPIAPEKKKEKAGEDCGGGVVAPPCRQTEENKERYAKIAGLLREDGVHFSGVVNPTQLARYLNL